MDNRLFPVISGKELAPTQQFYERLGFVKAYQFPPDGEPDYVSMSRGVNSIGIGAGGEEAFSIWAYVDDVDFVIEELRRSGIEIISEPADQPWGERMAEVRDPAGILVRLANPTT